MGPIGTIKIIFGGLLILLIFLIMLVSVIIIDVISFALGKSLPGIINWLIVVFMPYVLFRMTYLLIKRSSAVDF